MSEWPILIPPPPRFGPSVKGYLLSDHYICLQHLLFLSLISVCVDLDEIESLFGISFAENLTIAFGFLSPQRSH